MPAHERAYHHGDLRRALLDASRALLEEGGLDALTLRSVARHAGVNHMAPYHHFDDRSALVAAPAAEGFGELGATMSAAIAAESDPVAAFLASGRAYVVFGYDHPALFALMFGPELGDRSDHPTLAAAASEAFGVLIGAIDECQRAGAARDGDPLMLARAAWSGVHGLAHLVVDRQIAPARSSRRAMLGLVDETLHILWQGIRS
jgi:AcrR family transcriptional regulator